MNEQPPTWYRYVYLAGVSYPVIELLARAVVLPYLTGRDSLPADLGNLLDGFLALAFCVALAMVTSAISSIAEVTDAGDWYVERVDLVR